MIISFIFFLLFPNLFLKAQPQINDHYIYLSPVPNAEMVMPSTAIMIRGKESFTSLTAGNPADIIVKGEKSGFHEGRIIYLENNSLLSFKPFIPFEYGEKVTVELKNESLSRQTDYVPDLKYSFRITEKIINESMDLLSSIKSELIAESNNENAFNNNVTLYPDSLPDDFPGYTVKVNNPADGYIFFSSLIWIPDFARYIIIMDKYGVPVFYRHMPSRVYDFQKQLDGNITFIEADNPQFFVMNNKYEITDSVAMQNGYSADVHELRILEDGHYLLMGYDLQHVGMDTVVTGGNPGAVVTGLVLQELDENKNLVFQWRSWDHFKITDATYDISLTDSLIDYVHANAIETDYDGNILLSCRHLDEITKINRTTGEIMWRWGGKYCKNNQFNFLNDSIGFSHQHCIRRLPNGNYTMFDNGNLHDPQFSRAVEYNLNQTDKTVTLVWEHRNNPSDFTFAMGSTERLINQNTFIGWGTQPKITEVAPDGTETFSLNLLNNAFAYRAFKYDWDTNLFTCDKDTLDFGIVQLNNAGTVFFDMTNNTDQTVEINSIFNRNSSFTLQEHLPVVIPSHSTVNLSVKFNPDTAGIYDDDLHLRWETEGQRIAKVIHLSGVTDSVYLAVNDDLLLEGFSLGQNYPNPFNPVSTIKYSIPHSALVQLKVFDILGNEITTLVNKEQTAGSYEVGFDGSDLASGIYFYRLNTGEFTSVKKMLLLK